MSDFFSLQEYKKKRNRLSDVLEWLLFVAPGIVMNKDESFMKVFTFRGKDRDSNTAETLMNCGAIVNTLLKRFGSGWAFYVEAVRIKCEEYPTRTFMDALSQTLDDDRRIFFNAGQHYETKYYMTIMYRPQDQKSNSFFDFIVEKEKEAKDKKMAELLEYINYFRNETESFASQFATVVDYLRPLDDNETATYFHNCISNRPHFVNKPMPEVFLDELLPDAALVGGFQPRLGHPQDPDSQYIKVVAVKGLSSGTFPGLLDALNRLPFEYRWVTRYIFMDDRESKSYLEEYRRQWDKKKKTYRQIVSELMTKEPAANYDPEAVANVNDALSALESLGCGEVSFGFITISVVIKDKDIKSLEKKAEEIRKVLELSGLTTINETRSAVDAWLGSLPGMCKWMPRYQVANTLNFAHYFPLSAVWAGYRWNKIMNCPPILFSQTGGSTPFRLNLHIGDVGHTMIVGPTGAGKSVLLNTIAIQTRGIPGSQVYIFDVGGSSRVTTAGVGGDYYDVGSEAEDGLSFQPLRNIADEQELNWANEWVTGLYVNQGIELTQRDKADIWDTLKSMQSYEKDLLRLSTFKLLVQNQTLKEGITPFTMEGPYGRILDSDHDNLSYGNWQVFEMDKLVSSLKGAIKPVLTYLFHRIEENCNGPWTFIIFDESWVYLNDEYFSAWMEKQLRVARKRRAAVIFATQNIEDTMKSKIAHVVVNQCLTKIYLPNGEALNSVNYNTYSDLGLNEREINLIAQSVPKHDYYYKSRLGSRKFDLALSMLAIKYVGASSPEEQEVAKEILKKYPKEDFNDHWLARYASPEARDYYLNLKEKFRKGDLYE